MLVKKIQAIAESLLIILIIYLFRELIYYAYSFLTLSRESGSSGVSLDFIIGQHYLYDVISWTLIVIVLLVLNLGMKQPVKNNFFLHKVGLKYCLVAILCGFGLVFLVNGIANGLALTLGTDFTSSYRTSNTSMIYMILLPGIVLPVFEELVYRGFILSRLRKVFMPTVCIYLAAALFSFGHFDLVQGLYVLPLGILTVFVVLRSGSIWSGIIIHTVFNISNIYLYNTIFNTFNLSQMIVMSIIGVVLIGFGLYQVSQHYVIMDGITGGADEKD